MQRAPSRRAEAAALLLPLVGLFLLLPPFVTLFVGPVRVFGVPLIVFYLFGVWAALTVSAMLLARRLPLTDTEMAPVPSADAPADAPADTPADPTNPASAAKPPP